MSPRLTEEEVIAKAEADLEARKAKLEEKKKAAKVAIAKRIEAKEALIRKLDGEILELLEELGVEAIPLLDGRIPLTRLQEFKLRFEAASKVDITKKTKADAPTG